MKTKKSLSFLLGLVLCFPGLVNGQTKNIDCNATPSTPASWTLVSSQSNGTYAFNTTEAATKIVSFESKTVSIKGQEIVNKLNGTGLNACVFDFLMLHQELIPESWKEKKVIFTGSIFKDGLGNECVRHLYWWDGKWNGGQTYLEESYDDLVAAIK